MHRLAASGSADELQKQLTGDNEIVLTTDALDTELREIVGGIEEITDITTGAAEPELTVAHIRSNHENIYDLSAAVFRAFVGSGKLILEMTLKRGNLEDVFIELSEAATVEIVAENMEESEVAEE